MRRIALVTLFFASLVPALPAEDLSIEHLAAADQRWPHALVATFAGGCFWCMEGPFRALPGVLQVASGYTGGSAQDATYRRVIRGGSGHVEAVRIHYDPRRINFAELVDVYWRQIDPTDKGGQFADRGDHYRPLIAVHNDEQRRIAEASRAALAASGPFTRTIVVAIEDAQPFYYAEIEHQRYSERNPEHYQRYRLGSGRAGFLERSWSTPAAAPAANAAFPAHLAPWTDVTKPDRETLREQLSDLQYRVTQEDATEPPFRNAYWDHTEHGIYVDIVSGEPLFASVHRFDSRSGWPSFSQALEPRLVRERDDQSHGMRRIEVRSRFGDSHLGHLFHDGPQPTGLRYCINSAALRFIPLGELEAAGLGRYRALFAPHLSPAAEP